MRNYIKLYQFHII